MGGVIGKVRVVLSIVFVCFFMLALKAHAVEVRLGILHGDVELFSYEIGLVRMALDHADGDHDLKLVELRNVPQARVMAMLQNNHDLNTFITGYSEEREKKLLQVDIPVTRGLLGHRVFMVRKGNETLLQDVKTLEALKKIRMGSGVDWMDTKVLESAGFDVVTSTYQNLWLMLEGRRFEAFNRGIGEVVYEYERIMAQNRPLSLDPHVMISYPFDAFIYVNPQNDAIHRVLSQGLERAYKSGAFLNYFRNHETVKRMVKLIKPTERVHIRLPNPHISDRVKKILPQYWHGFSAVN